MLLFELRPRQNQPSMSYDDQSATQEDQHAETSNVHPLSSLFSRLRKAGYFNHIIANSSLLFQSANPCVFMTLHYPL